MNTIQDGWEGFEKMVVPHNAGDVQRTEMKKAFYAGATAAISVMMEISAEEVSDDAGIEVFQGLIEECQAFSVGILK